MSISITVLNAFSGSPEIGAREFPAPLEEVLRLIRGQRTRETRVRRTADDKADSSKRRDSLLDRFFQLRRLADISGRWNTAATL